MQPGPPSSEDVPGWAWGQRPFPDESPEAFACRMMDARYGRANGFEAAFAIGEVRNLKKSVHVDRCVPFADPNVPSRPMPLKRGNPTRDPGAVVLHQVHHFHVGAGADCTDDDEDNEKEIGVYASPEQIRAAIARLSDQPGFRVFSVVLDEVAWGTGFISIRDPRFFGPAEAPDAR